MNPYAPIGVFDSGVGGLSILRALRSELSHEHFVYYADALHAPYGERADAFVAERSLAVASELVETHGIKALVVACNTATAAAIDLLRASHRGLPVVGVEPALKPATLLSTTRRIGVFATRGTLTSPRFAALQGGLKDQATFLLQPCDGLAAAVETGDAMEIRALCARYMRATGRFGIKIGEIDTLVLGCTHYAFAAPQLEAMLPPGVRLVETGEPVARQTRRLLDAAGLLQPDGIGSVSLCGSGSLPALQQAAARWLS